MTSKMAGTIKGALVLLALACALAALAPGAHAAPPNAGPQTIAVLGFEGPADTFAEIAPLPNTVPGDLPTSAYWGRTSQAHYTGSGALWCAGTKTPGDTPSTTWPYYTPGTRGSTTATFTALADYYAASVAFRYKMESIGSEDDFHLGWRNAAGGHNTTDQIPQSSAWTLFTYDLSSGIAPKLSRDVAALSLVFWDHNETGSGDTTGTGPVVDDFTVSGYRYGPVTGVTATGTPWTQPVALQWAVPDAKIGSSADETRSVTYRVWRAENYTDVWQELTGARLTATQFTDVTTAPGIQYKYVVQAWDPGSGDGRGMQSVPAVWPAPADMPLATLGAPSLPAVTVYRWRPFASVGTIWPAHAKATTVEIQTSRNQSAIANTYLANVPAGTTTYSSTAVKLPATGTWYIRARHEDSTHRESFSAWQQVTVSGALTLGKPKAATKMRLNKTYTAYGTIKPLHASTTYLKVRAYRWNGKSYGYVKSISVKLTSKGQAADTAKYTASVKLTKKGKWKLKLKHSAHGEEPEAYSAYSSVITVK